LCQFLLSSSASIVVFVCFGWVFVNAQNQKITILNEDSSPLAGAQIIIFADSSSTQITDYYQSDQNGQVEFPKQELSDRIWVDFRYLGYKNRKLPWIKVKRLSKIILEKDQEDIETIIVKERAPKVISREDTTIYNVSQIMDSTEYFIEDVIKKLPGVEVDEHGIIKVDGKNIQTVLIDNSTLLGRQYNIGTQNIRVEDVDNIEVIRNFESNPVMKDFHQSEEIALNLSIKEEKKNLWIMDFSAAQGLGNEYKYNAQGKGYQFSKVLKSLLVGNTKNAGAGYSISELKASQLINTGGNLKQPYYFSEPISSIVERRRHQLPNDYFNNANSRFTSANLEWNSSKNSSVQANFIFTEEGDQQSIRSEETYALDSSQYRIVNLEKRQLSKRHLKGDVEWKHYSTDRRKSLSFFTAGYVNSEGGNLNLKQPLLYKHNNQDFWMNSGIEWVQNISANWLYRVNSRYIVRGNDISSAIGNADYSILIPELNQDSTLYQRLDQNNQIWDSKGELIFRHTLGISSITFQYQRKRLRRTNRLADQPLSKEDATAYSFDRPLDQTIDQERFSFSATQIVELYNFKFSVNPTVEYWRSNLSTRPAKTEQFSFRLSSFLRRKFKNESILTLRYHYHKTPASIEEFLSVPVIFSPFSLRSHLSQLEQNMSQQISAYYKWEERKNMTAYSIRLRYLFGAQIWSSQIQFLNRISEVQPLFTEGNDRLLLNAMADNFFPSIATGVTIDPYAAWSLNQVQVNSDNFLAIRERTGLKLKLYSRLSNKLRGVLESRFENNISFREGDRDQGNSNQLFKVSPKLTFKSQSWQIELEGQYLEIYANKQKSSQFLSGSFSIRKELTFDEKKLYLFLELYNLGNQNSFDIARNTDLFFYQESIQMIPFFFLTKATYSFSI